LFDRPHLAGPRTVAARRIASQFPRLHRELGATPLADTRNPATLRPHQSYPFGAATGAASTAPGHFDSRPPVYTRSS
jgi:hypothetical protein